MSVDVNQVQPGANAATPPPAVPDLAGWVATQAQSAIAKTVEDGVAQITAQATQQASDVATALHNESLAKIDEVGNRLTQVASAVAPQVQAALTDAIPQIKASVLADVQAVGQNIQHDATTQRHIALLLVFLLGEAAIALLVFYCIPATSPQVKGIIGWASVPAIGSAFVAWAATGFKTPLKSTGA